MKLTKVTFTGADDSVDIQELLNISKAYPWTEWGILIAHGHYGSYRFPSNNWIREFVESVDLNPEQIQVSSHVCGDWVRKLLIGTLNWSSLPSIISVSNRIQINTHSELHLYHHTEFVNKLLELSDKEFIFQMDEVNEHLMQTVCHKRNELSGSALFDMSAGAGITPEVWPRATPLHSCGYAGGLGPDNVVEQLERIQAANDHSSYLDSAEFWIDMERNIRTPDDSRFDLDKVIKVLELTHPFIYGLS